MSNLNMKQIAYLKNLEIGLLKITDIIDLFDTIEAQQKKIKEFDQDRINYQNQWAEACKDVLELQKEIDQLKEQQTKIILQWETSFKLKQNWCFELGDEIRELKAQINTLTIKEQKLHL